MADVKHTLTEILRNQAERDGVSTDAHWAMHNAADTIDALVGALEQAERCMSNSPATFEHDLPVIRAALAAAKAGT